jgi:peptidoglycan/LPS O-acetylase OafA/YrhL
MGMAIFFTLSGFLITSFLISHSDVTDFLIRRFFRILPLAWLCMVVAAVAVGGNFDFWLANFLFYANWPPVALGEINGHLWSLCVEIQFYVAIALLALLLGKYWMWAIPVLCLAFTAYRIHDGVHVSIYTYYRIDEILAGSVLALVYRGVLGKGLKAGLARAPRAILLFLFAISCHPDGEFLNYFRPYLAACLVGSTLLGSETRFSRALNNRALAYLAAISYALYVIHPLLAYTWLGSGEGLAKYAKRPLLLAALFLTAHLSTFHYERRWIALGKSLARRTQRRFA